MAKKTDNDMTEVEDFDKFELMDAQREVFEYRPTAMLDIPANVKEKFDEQGYDLKWVRYMLGGQIDVANLRLRQSPNEGYSYVKPQDVDKADLMQLGGIDQFSGQDIIVNGDVVLMKVRKEQSEARRKYFEQQTRNRSLATKQMLEQNRISMDNKSVVRTGKNAHFSGQY